MMNIKNDYLLPALLLLLTLPVFGQGWERHYTETTPSTSEIHSIVADPSGGFLMLFSLKDPWGSGNSNSDIFIQKTNDAGIIQWVKSYDYGAIEEGVDFIHTSDGGYAVLYKSRGVNVATHVGLLKLDGAFNQASNQIVAPGVQYVNFDPSNVLEVQGNLHVIYSAYDTTILNTYHGDWRGMESIFDLNGNVVAHHPKTQTLFIKDAVVAPNNDRVGLVLNGGSNQWGLMRMGANEWTTLLAGPGISQYYYGGAVVNAPGGGFYACLAASGVPAITKVDDNGAYQWQKTYPNHPDSLNILTFINVVPVADGSGYWATGFEPGATSRLIIFRLDPQCNRLWSKAYGTGTFHNQYYPLLALPDNGVVTGGSNGLYWTNFHKVAYRLDANGVTFNSGVKGVVSRDTSSDCIGDLTAVNAGLEARAWQNGVFMNADRVDDGGEYHIPLDSGNYQITVEKINQAWFLCTDTIPVNVQLNNTLTTDFVNYYNPTPFDSIYGYVFRDIDGDCMKDSFETQGYAGWTVYIDYNDGVNALHTTVTTDANGYYVVYNPSGFSNTGYGFIYPVEPQGNGLTCDYFCGGEKGYDFLNGNSVQLDFGRHCDTLPPCPLMEVDLAAWALRPCLNSSYSVHYCNNGFETAQNAYVEVTIDSALQVVSSTIPWSSVNNHVYTFNVGNVSSEFCGDFQITVFVPCEDPVGTTYCSSAHIYPDTPCVSPQFWDGSEVQVSAQCVGDSVIFTIQNVGTGAMISSQEYVVIEDNILFMAIPGQFQLGAGESTQVTVPATGHFFRIEAEQSPGFPGLGNPVAWAEGCGGTGNVSLGFVNQYPLGDEDPWLDVFCRESVNSCDPNDKTGFPYGVKEEHYIRQNTEMEYLIRFQNTGTADALNIEVRDTIPVQFLDPATVRPGASSHHYEWDMQGNGVVVFRFPNINLPDMASNEDESHGFVKFRVSQRKDLPIGTVIRNNADIYFDNNAAVETNETWHTIGEDFLSKTQVVYTPDMNVLLQPNPATDHVRITLDGLTTASKEHSILLRTVLGVPVKSQTFTGATTNLDVSGLPAGVYFYEIKGGKGTVATGRLVKI